MKSEIWKVGDVICHSNKLRLKVIEVKLGEVTVAPVEKPKLPLCRGSQEFWVQSGFERIGVSNVCYFPIVS